MKFKPSFLKIFSSLIIAFVLIVWYVVQFYEGGYVWQVLIIGESALALFVYFLWSLFEK